MKLASRPALCAVLAGLTGCAVGPDYHTPDLPPPPAFVAATQAASSLPTTPAEAAHLARAQWWRSLDDPRLNALVDQAIAANPDVDIALTRLQQARAEEIVLLNGALPVVAGAAGAANGSGSDLTRGRVPSAMTSADNTSGSMKEIRQVAGFDADWELDLFGKYRRAIEAGGYTAKAAAEARNQVLVTVIADVVRAYVDLRGSQIRLAVLRQGVAVAAKSRDVVKMRFERGLTNELDLTLAEREVATRQAGLAPLAADIDAAQDTIALLLGRYPEEMGRDLAKAAEIPALPERIEPGLPLELIKRRPDIREAERQLAAATARVGVATANLFPQISLIGALGTQSAAIGLDSARHIWSLGPSAYWPLLDFGALDAQVDIADLETHARLVGYKRTVLSAVGEVDAATSAFAAQQERVKNLSKALWQSQRAVELATERYDRGLTDFLNVVDAERQQYALAAELVAAEQSAADEFVAVFKSLGGGWENYQQVPPARVPRPAILAMFDHLAP